MSTKKPGKPASTAAKAVRFKAEPVEEVSKSAPTPRQEELRIPLGVPSVYADRIIDVVYGVSTTKLVFATENGQRMTPAAVVIIPTHALLSSVLRIAENLSNPSLIQETASRYANFLAGMQALRADNEAREKATNTASSRK